MLRKRWVGHWHRYAGLMGLVLRVAWPAAQLLASLATPWLVVWYTNSLLHVVVAGGCNHIRPAFLCSPEGLNKRPAC